MTFTAIIQARMSSKRFPGKVLRPLAGKPLIGYLIERLRLSEKISGVVVATSTDSSDDPLVRYCREEKIVFFRGHLRNVAGRFEQALRAHKIGHFVRLNADSPFLDYRIVDLGIKTFKKEKPAVVTNIWPRTFPSGQSVEIFDAAVFLAHCSRIRSPYDQEHVTPYFYKHAALFNIHSLCTEDGDHSAIDLSVNLPGDLKIAYRALRRLGPSYQRAPWQEVAAVYERICLAGTRAA